MIKIKLVIVYEVFEKFIECLYVSGKSGSIL